jgi:hypothetical protein
MSGMKAILSGKKPKGIHIKPANKGKLRKLLGTKKGKNIPVAKEEALKAHGSPAEKKEANFALNARKFNHSK